MKKLKNLTIFVEGAEDSRFLQDVIQAWYNIKISRPSSGNKTSEKKQSGELTDIIHVGGKTSVHEAVPIFQESTSNELQNILILDADNERKDEKWGGVERTRAYLKYLREQYGIKIDHAYIFPHCTEQPQDGEDTEGDLETILDAIVVEQGLLRCWAAYTECVRTTAAAESKNYEPPRNKTKFYAYTEAVMRDSDDAGGSKRTYLNEFWNLDYTKDEFGGTRYLKPLKEFFDKFFLSQDQAKA